MIQNDSASQKQRVGSAELRGLRLKTEDLHGKSQAMVYHRRITH